MLSEVTTKLEAAVTFSALTAGVVHKEMNRRAGRVDVFVEDFEEGVFYRVYDEHGNWEEGDRVWFVPEPKLRYRQKWTKYVALRI